MANNPSLPASPKQYTLDLGIEVEKSVGGVEMGVLENGMPYLTQTGLATMSGAARSTIFEITQEWSENIDQPINPKTRLGFFQDYLFRNGYAEPELFVEITKNGSLHYAYPDIVCMAIIEYYAFDAQRKNPTALENYRRLARFGIQNFIFEALGYDPEDKWKWFNDRVSILQNSEPADHFIVFKETTGLVVDLINADLRVNSKTIPDISVGIAWGKYWTANSFDQKYGNRVKFEHNFPSYYPQADSNPQTPWAYPDAALPVFRKWFKEVYLPTKFPKYILSKAKVLPGGGREAERLANLYSPKAIKGK